MGLNKDRLRRMRNWQSSEFYSRLVMRPVSILIMLVVGDWRWLTPNLITTFANVAKIAGAVLIVIDHHQHTIVAAVLLQVGLLLDHLDGTLARYRNAGSTLGAFYDKVSDALTWLAITGAIGWAAYRDHGDVLMPILSLSSAYLLLVLGYMKWIVAAATVVSRRQQVNQAVVEPPSRTPKQWALWFLSSLARAFAFEEVDLYFWMGLGLVMNRLDLLVWLLAISQAVQLVIMLIKRALQARALDVAHQHRAAA